MPKPMPILCYALKVVFIAIVEKFNFPNAFLRFLQKKMKCHGKLIGLSSMPPVKIDSEIQKLFSVKLPPRPHPSLSQVWSQVATDTAPRSLLLHLNCDVVIQPTSV